MEDEEIEEFLTGVRRRLHEPGAAEFVVRLRRGPPWLPVLPPYERRVASVLLRGLVEFALRELGVPASQSGRGSESN